MDMEIYLLILLQKIIRLQNSFNRIDEKVQEKVLDYGFIYVNFMCIMYKGIIGKVFSIELG